MALIDGENTDEAIVVAAGEEMIIEDIGNLSGVNSQGKLYCSGLHSWLEPEEFKLDVTKRYSDHYIRLKGLWESFGGVLDAQGLPVYDEEGNPVRAQTDIEINPEGAGLDNITGINTTENAVEPDFAKTPEPGSVGE